MFIEILNPHNLSPRGATCDHCVMQIRDDKITPVTCQYEA